MSIKKLAKDLPAGERFLRGKQVVEITGLPLPTLYREAGMGNFPKPFRLTRATSAWRESDIRQWMTDRPLFDQDGGPPQGDWADGDAA